MQTELTWRIRFRPKLPGTGRPLAIVLSWLLGRVLRSGLKPHVEALARQTTGGEPGGMTFIRQRKEGV